MLAENVVHASRRASRVRWGHVTTTWAVRGGFEKQESTSSSCTASRMCFVQLKFVVSMATMITVVLPGHWNRCEQSHGRSARSRQNVRSAQSNPRVDLVAKFIDSSAGQWVLPPSITYSSSVIWPPQQLSSGLPFQLVVSVCTASTEHDVKHTGVMKCNSVLSTSSLPQQQRTAWTFHFQATVRRHYEVFFFLETDSRCMTSNISLSRIYRTGRPTIPVYRPIQYTVHSSQVCRTNAVRICMINKKRYDIEICECRVQV